ncbi:hypothetical protein [Methanolobus sp. WCC4]|uniref:hypothetical protein n=1 Tax=Methanolobus sp. WCC4 TaxID=3125784 RepID=UPI0030FAFF4D
MKFIERLFGKKQEKEESHPVVFVFRELPRIVKERSDEQEESLRPVVKDGYGTIALALKELEVLKKELLDAQPIEAASKRGEKLGDSNRENVVNNLKLIQDKLKIPGNTSPLAASEFYIEAKSTLKTVLDNTSRSLMYIKALYPQEHQMINQGLAELEDGLDGLYSSIAQGNKMVADLQMISENIDDIRMIEEEMDKSTKKIHETNLRYEAAKDRLSRDESRLKEIGNSREFGRAKELENDIKELDSRISNTGSEARRLFTPLSKAITRMEKQDENKRCVLSSENREILRSIKEDPAIAIEQDLEPFLSEITNRIESGELGLKEQMCDKALKQIQVLNDKRMLSSLAERRHEHLAEREGLADELNGLSIYQEKENIEKEIEKHRNDVISTNNDIDSESKHLYSQKDDMENAKNTLLTNVRKVFGEESEIEY